MLEGIVEKINSKGWNLYEFKSDENINVAVPRGAVSRLEIGKDYVLFPRIKEDKDLLKMNVALEEMEKNKVFPLINYNNIPVALAYFSFRERRLIVHGVTEVEIDYGSFREVLDTLVSRYVS